MKGEKGFSGFSCLPTARGQEICLSVPRVHTTFEHTQMEVGGAAV